LLLGLALLLLPACDWIGEPVPGRQFGLSLTDSGDIVVRYDPCVYEGVSVVELRSVKGHIFGDNDDPILWEATSDQDTRLETFTVGNAPPGFSETIPLQGMPPSGERLGIIVSLPNARATQGTTFKIEELKTGEFLDARGNYVSLETFLVSDKCNR
jgi:hypothetical protein